MEENSRVGEATGRRERDTREDWERKKQVGPPSNVIHVESLLFRQASWGDFSLKAYPKSKRAGTLVKILFLADLMLFQFIGDCAAWLTHLSLWRRNSDS